MPGFRSLAFLFVIKYVLRKYSKSYISCQPGIVLERTYCRAKSTLAGHKPFSAKDCGKVCGNFLTVLATDS